MTNDKQRERLVELLEKASVEAGKHIRETTKKVLAEKGSFNSREDIDRRNIYEIEADYLLANGVIVPLCKVGQDIYTIQGDEVTKHFVIEVARHNNGKTYCKYVPYDKKGNVQWFYVQSSFTEDAIGKTVFLTKEEAEKALGGVQG